MRPRVLVAGVGNVLLGDDGFGVEVVQRLAGVALPSWVQLADHGLGCGRLDCDMLGGYDTTILLDATPRGGSPGQLCVIEAEVDEQSSALPALLDAHGIQPKAAIRLLHLLGSDAGRVVVVGCEPAKTVGIGLSPAVAEAVTEAVRIVTDLVWGTEPPGSVRSVQAEPPRQLEPMGGE
ncbi:hydrogenase maturation protease [Saccharomonospora amisosensis]|uniref:Hydrogenase maturation protease n=1 Tax=Saccharomonospora amisosensis TaxID=1128677 RepID=A0A7X5ZQA8_9PSEU|nr:hydrogenase maturation protease [Saccharomonospora amisosensis]NIJ11306.1 hydrogenase maturation protease [Saccharomonospora amisosensis]